MRGPAKYRNQHADRVCEVMKALRAEPMTAQEIADFIGCYHHSVRSNLLILVQHGIVTKTGGKRTGKTGGLSALYAVTKAWGGRA